MEATGDVDAEGWAYAFDWPHLRYPPAPGSGLKKAKDFVRRRRWVRRRRQAALPSTVLDMAPAGGQPGGRQSQVAASREVWVRNVSRLVWVVDGCVIWACRGVLCFAGADCLPSPHQNFPTHQVLGSVEPGGSVPLPHCWNQHSKQLQVRPILPGPAPQDHPQLTAFDAALQVEAARPAEGEAAAAATAGEAAPPSPAAQPPQPPPPPGSDGDAVPPSHSWSFGASAGQHSVPLTGLEDGATRLLCCKTLAATAAVAAAPDDEEEGLAPSGGGGGGASAGQSVASPRRAARRAPACWISACTESTQLNASSGLDSMSDWWVAASFSVPVAG